MLKAKLGVAAQQPSAQTGTENDYDEYVAVFDGPLSHSKCEANRALFPAGGVDLELEVGGIWL